MMNPHVDTLERKPVYPVSYGDTAGNNPDVLEREAMSIKSELTGANRERTQDLISQLKGLQSRIPVGGRKSRRTSSVIATAIVQAQQQLEVQMLDHSWRSSEVMPVVMEAALYHGMTVAQKAFYNDIEKKAEYNLAAVNEKGKIEATGEKKITGEELRKHFGVLQYHSLKESEKRELLSKTFGTAAPDEDTPKTKAQLKADQEELASIHRALHDMEAYKAYVLLVHSGLGVRAALAQISRNRKAFAKAHADITALHDAYGELMEAPDDGMANAKMAVERRQMKATLKDDIIDGILAEDTDGKDEKEPPTLIPKLLSGIWSPSVGR